MNRRLSLLIAALLLTPVLVKADVNGSPTPYQLYGSITGHVVLQPNTNYEVIGDLRIESGASLTLSNGTNVSVASNSDYLARGRDRSLIEIDVLGSLVGNDPSSINSTNGSWWGIHVAPTGTLSLTKVSLYGGRLDLASGAPVMLDQCTWGVSLSAKGSQVTLRDSFVYSVAADSGTSCVITRGELVELLVYRGSDVTLLSSSVPYYGRCVVDSSTFTASSSTLPFVSSWASVVRLRSCDVRRAGLQAWSRSLVEIDSCRIDNSNNSYAGNSYAGVESREGSSVYIRNSKVGESNPPTNGAACYSGASLYLENSVVWSRVDGIFFDSGTNGHVRGCTVSKVGNDNSGTGIVTPFSLVDDRPSNPRPNIISGFYIGILASPAANAFSNIVVRRAFYAIGRSLPTGLRMTVDYCTLIDCIYVGYYADTIQATNSILRNVSVGTRSMSVNNVVWHNTYGAAWTPYSGGSISFGPFISSYDPFMDADGRLSPASFYTNFSSSGGQIGAYGPGPVGPTPVLAASLVEASGVNGKARIRWHATSTGNSKASVFRRVEGGEWEPLTVLYPDGQGYVVLEDEAVEAGTRYGYGLGTQNEHRVGIEGVAWVTVESVVRELQSLTVGPNPGTDHWNIAFSAPAGSPTTVDVLDLMGRVVRSAGAVFGNGRHTVRIDHHDIQPGIYWVRLRQNDRTLLAKAVKMR